MSTETMPNPVEVLSPEHGPKRREEVTVATSGRSFGSTWYFAFFFISGFCSILYELIWLRLAMAQFGVTTAMISIVLSSFMAGLGVGSLAAGHLVRKYAPHALVALHAAAALKHHWIDRDATLRRMMGAR